jgi:hypothetical protein
MIQSDWTETEQVDITCWPLWLVEPKIEQQGALQQKLIGPSRNTQAIQQALERVPSEQEVEIHFVGTRPIQQARTDGRTDILGRAHPAARDSMYGRITFATRQIAA